MATSAAAPRRTQAERRSESEAALLVAAAELVAERGIERASLASIGERAGTSRGLPTHHFGSKDGLMERLTQQAQDRIYDAMVTAARDALESDSELRALDLIRLAIDTYLEIFETPDPQERALIVIWGTTFPSTSSVEGMVEADRRSYAGWTELVAAGQTDGSIRCDLEPGDVAVLILGMMRGVAGQLLTDPELADVRHVRETSRAWISAALAPLERA